MSKAIRLQRLAIAVLLLFIASACGTTRKVIKRPLKEEGIDYVFNMLKVNEFAFTTFSAKFSAFARIDKKETHLSGQVRVKRDSTIWVSLTPALGLEAARILITLDSVFFLNRLENSYLKTDYSFINNHLNAGFDFDLLQAMLLGNDLRYYENNQFRVVIDEHCYRLNTIGRRKLKKNIRNSTENLKVLVQSIWVNPDNGKIGKVHTKELGKENKKLEVVYSGFIPVADQLFPSHQEIRIEAEKNITITLDFSKIKTNETLGFPFSIPARFTNLSGN